MPSAVAKRDRRCAAILQKARANLWMMWKTQVLRVWKLWITPSGPL